MTNDREEELERLEKELLPEETLEEDQLVDFPIELVESDSMTEEPNESLPEEEITVPPEANAPEEEILPEQPEDEILTEDLEEILSEEPEQTLLEDQEEATSPVRLRNYAGKFVRKPNSDPATADQTQEDKWLIGLMIAASALCVGILGILIYWMLHFFA